MKARRFLMALPLLVPLVAVGGGGDWRSEGVRIAEAAMGGGGDGGGGGGRIGRMYALNSVQLK